MTIEKRLITIARNQQRIYDAGFAAGQAAGGDTNAAYQAGVHSVYENMTLVNYMFYRGHNKNNYETFLNSDLSNVTTAQYLFQENDWIVEFALPITLKPNLIHYMFQNCKTIQKVSGLERLQTNVLTGVFSDCVALEDAGTIDFTKVGFANRTFLNCTALKEIRIAGTIGLSVDFQYSPLSKASIESIMAALSDTTTGTSVTFSNIAVNAAFTTDEWNALVATKPNWTVTLV